jgi:hypothetical protein
MNKKLARKIRQKREKERNRPDGYSPLEAAVKNLRILPLTEEQKEQIVKNCLGEICTICNKKITKKDLKANRFVGLAAYQSGVQKYPDYLAHPKHFFEEDGQTATADQLDNYKLFEKRIAEKELGPLLKN